ncbi:MAG: hypothetical protein ABIQ51_05675 [Mesorhizobium sp.]
MGNAISRIGNLVTQGVLDAAAWDAGLAAIVDMVHTDHLVAVLPQGIDDPYPRIMPLAWGSVVADENIKALADLPSRRGGALALAAGRSNGRARRRGASAGPAPTRAFLLLRES